MTQYKKFTSTTIYECDVTIDKIKLKLDKKNIKYIIINDIINIFKSTEEYDNYIKQQEIKDAQEILPSNIFLKCEINDLNKNVINNICKIENNEKKDIIQEENKNLIKLTKKEYQKQYQKKYREEHKKKLNDKSKEYREVHKEELKNKQQIYYERNKEAILTQKRTYDAKKRLKKQQENEINNV